MFKINTNTKGTLSQMKADQPLKKEEPHRKMDAKKAASTSGKKTGHVGMLAIVGCRVTVELDDGTSLTGKLLSYDRHQNVVLGDAERTRRTKKTNRLVHDSLGLVYLRGNGVVSVSYKPSITSKRVVIDSRTDGRAQEARRAQHQQVQQQQQARPPLGLDGGAPGGDAGYR